jgi:hypothetical protein
MTDWSIKYDLTYDDNYNSFKAFLEGCGDDRYRCCICKSCYVGLQNDESILKFYQRSTSWKLFDMRHASRYHAKNDDGSLKGAILKEKDHALQLWEDYYRHRHIFREAALLSPPPSPPRPADDAGDRTVRT